MQCYGTYWLLWNTGSSGASPGSLIWNETSTAHADTAPEKELDFWRSQLYLPLESRTGRARLSSAEGFCSSGKGAFHTEGERPELVTGARWAPKAPEHANPWQRRARSVRNNEQYPAYSLCEPSTDIQYSNPSQSHQDCHSMEGTSDWFGDDGWAGNKQGSNSVIRMRSRTTINLIECGYVPSTVLSAFCYYFL